MPRRKNNVRSHLPEDILDVPDPVVRKMHDPQEVRIYIKLLRKALKFLPLGSRAYYYVSGEILRASTQLKTLGPSSSTESQGRDARGSSSHSHNDGN